MSYKRTLDELREHAVLHWSDELLEAASKESILYNLLNTQDEFISILKVATQTPLSWKIVLEQSKNLTLPLFTKHLMILCNLGGETLNKILPIEEYFPDVKIRFPWGDDFEEYTFNTINNVSSLTNSSLKLTHKTIKGNGHSLLLLTDLVMILMYGSIGVNDILPPAYKERCIVGSILGNPDQIDKFIKENYIRVSTQIKGAESNSLGHFAQNYVTDLLVEYLPKNWKVTMEGSLSGVAHNEDGSETNFDVVVVSPKAIEFGIEVSFQVTTNSVIERKARDSSALISRAKEKGHHVCYVIDGAGNINIRKKAVETICTNSNCTVALSKSEIKHLAGYLIKNG